MRGPRCAGARTSCRCTRGLRTLLCTGALVEVAGALLGEPAVLYKEKVNYKLPGGAGYSPHQDAPAYPMIDVHVSAMVAVDDADESNGGLEVVSGCFDARAPTRRARVHRASRSSSSSTGSPCRCAPDRRSGSTAAPRTAAGPTAPISLAGPLYPTYNAAREGDLRAAYYDAKRAAFAGRSVGDRARVSLIGDFEGRPV